VTFKLYGTLTSPFVRRVRVVAAEAGQPFELVIAPPDGPALGALSPIAKVPVIEDDGRVIFDSRAIIDYIVEQRGWGGLAEPRDRWAHANYLNAIDGALESAIQVFYLRRDGFDVASMPFAEKQRHRIAAIFGWLADEIAAARFGVAPRLAELSLACTLDWMEFRETFAVASLGGRLDVVRTMFAARPSFAPTAPVG
jgi:glutathione S-transferase